MKRYRLLIALVPWLCVVFVAATAASETRVQPTDFSYLGAFRLPDGGERPLTFEYGGSALTFNPDGDPAGAADGFAGSLFVVGHDRLAYGELPSGSQIAEVTIPAPIVTRDVGALPQAEFVQDFHDVMAGYFIGLDELPRVGMQYLNTRVTGPKIHVTWGQHLQFEPASASQAWFDPALDTPNVQGTWFLDGQSPYSVTGYMLDVPEAWADQYADRRVVGTGRFRDGGWSGMGPALFAYRPWIDETGTPAPDQARLPATTLLLYAKSTETDAIEHALAGYQHPDEWEGAAWLETEDGRSAVLFAGTKSIGAKYWYGFINPAGPDQPCVHNESVGEFAACRLADGTLCPPEDLVECTGHNEVRGWWSARFEAQFILYDPADLAQVALEEIAPWEPQPYAVLPVDPALFLSSHPDLVDMVGSGVQRRYRLSDVTFDRVHHLLYVVELFADGAQPVVHVWRVGI